MSPILSETELQMVEKVKETVAVINTVVVKCNEPNCKGHVLLFYSMSRNSSDVLFPAMNLLEEFNSDYSHKTIALVPHRW